MKTVWLIASICVAHALHAQSPAAQQATRYIPGNYKRVATDNLDNIYLLSNQGQLKKLNAHGDSIAVYNNVKRYGETTIADVSNPLKVLLFYKDFMTVVVLDQMLSPRNTIDLRARGILKASTVALSYDGKIWVYDELENILKKIDETGSTIQQTADFRQLFDPAPLPQYITDRDNYVYLYDSLQGIYVFDYYGAFKNKIPIQHWQNLHIEKGMVMGSSANILYTYNPKSFTYNQWPLPQNPGPYRQYLVQNKRLLALKDDGLYIYPLP